MTRALLSLAASLILLSCSEIGATAAAEDTRGEKLWVFVGTYTGGASKGIYRFVMDLETGKLSERALAGESTNPSFLALIRTAAFSMRSARSAILAGRRAGLSVPSPSMSQVAT